MQMIRIRTLQQRFVVYMLLPVALLLAIMGVFGFIYARSTFLVQWEEAAILKLQRAAHHVDMRMARPKEWIRLYAALVGGHRHGEWMKHQIREELEKTEGVLSVTIQQLSETYSHESFFGGKGPKNFLSKNYGEHIDGNNDLHMTGPKFQITMPRYDPDSSNRTVSLITHAVSSENGAIYRVEVKMDFDFLLQHIPKTGWWESRNAYLIDEAGNILISTPDKKDKRFGESGGYLQKMTLSSMETNPYGTIRGPGHPPSEISGYYRLSEAPWYIVIIAPGEDILKPIINFRNYYFITLVFFIIIILFVIRRVTGQTALAVKELSRAAERIAQGVFNSPLITIKTRDEIGELARSFNTMTTQLKDRLRIRQSLDMAKEVQQSLLPKSTPFVKGLDIAGRSIYCEETGGDYFDYLHAGSVLHVVVGDVSGHGIPAALLMSSVRAGLRQCYCESENIAGQVSGLNRNVAEDVGDSGRFVTLFYLAVYPCEHRVRWVRAGHDPGIVYRYSDDRFENLGGTGLALGVDADYPYTAQTLDGFQAGDIILIGTDGIWEASNRRDGMFGKKSLRSILSQHKNDPAQNVVDAVFDAVRRHTGGGSPEDDMTLVVVKFEA
jgi:sigma-B regulation protein RsbU (phosphoserine phosphatase)